MLMLTILPFLLSVVIWGVALWQGLQPLIDWLQRYFLENDGFRISGNLSVRSPGTRWPCSSALSWQWWAWGH